MLRAWRITDDRTEEVIWASEAVREYTGLIVARKNLDTRSAQEKVKGVRDRPRRPINPEPADEFISDLGNISLSATTLAESSAQGTSIGTLSVAGVVPQVFILTDSAGGKFQLNASNSALLEAGPTLTDYETATSHSITVSALFGIAESFTITITDVGTDAGMSMGLLLALTYAV